MELLWTQDYAVGVIEIDNQHKELFVRINALMSAMVRGKGKEEIGNAIRFLEGYVVTHFNTEERLMTHNNYPDLALHKTFHTEFINNFSEIKKEFDTKGASSYLVIQLQNQVIEWLKNHIGKVDKVLGNFLKNKN